MSKNIDKKLAKLLKSAQKGDRDSLDTLCRELEQIIRGYFWQKFQKNDIVDDLSQETYLRLYHNLLKIKEPVKLRGFVTKIAIHVTHDYFRHQYRKKEEADFFQEGSEENLYKKDTLLELYDTSEQLINQIDLEQALERLPEKSRQILLMKINGYKYDEIAEEVGISVSGVKMQVQRSLEQLREILVEVTFFILTSTILLEKLS